jgi:hypothetical protein
MAVSSTAKCATTLVLPELVADIGFSSECRRALARRRVTQGKIGLNVKHRCLTEKERSLTRYVAILLIRTFYASGFSSN